MNEIKEQAGVVMLIIVLAMLLGALWIFRNDHDIELSVAQWVGGVVGGILALVTQSVAKALKGVTVTSANPQPTVVNNSVISDKQI